MESNFIWRLVVKQFTWALEVFESWGSKQWPGPWRARGARACNRGLGAEPPAGSRGRAPGGGSGGRSPPEAESFLVLERPTERQNSKMSKSIRLGLTSQCRRLKLLGEQELWPALPCQNLGEQLLPLLPLFQRPCGQLIDLSIPVSGSASIRLWRHFELTSHALRHRQLCDVSLDQFFLTRGRRRDNLIDTFHCRIEREIDSAPITWRDQWCITACVPHASTSTIMT